MNRLHRYPIAAYFLLVVCSALFATSLMASCTSSQRADTIHAAVISVDAARDGFVAWDRDHQQSLIDQSTSRDIGLKALASYRDQRQPIMDTFEVAYRALALAATQTDDPSLKAALSSAGDIVDAVKKLMGGL